MLDSLSQKLVQLGFSHNQASVYVALTALGQCKAGQIIKQTGLHRNIVYEALDELVNRKLAFKTSKGGVAFFQLSDASSLVHDAEQQLHLAQQVGGEINRLREKSQYEVKLYEGIDGLKLYREEVLRSLEPKNGSGGEFLMLGDTAKITRDLEDFWLTYHRQRSAAGIPARMFFSQQSLAAAQRRGMIPLTKTKILPANLQNSTTTDIWNDQVGIILYDTEPFVIAIKNAHFANSFREYFEQLWQQQAFVTTGLEAVHQLIYHKLDALEEDDEYVVLGSGHGVGQVQRLNISFFTTYHTARSKKGVRAKLMGAEQVRKNLEATILPGDPDLEKTEMRFMDKQFSSPLQIIIYPDSIVMVHWAMDAVAVEIQRQDVRDAMMLYFEALWKLAKK